MIHKVSVHRKINKNSFSFQNGKIGLISWGNVGVRYSYVQNIMFSADATTAKSFRSTICISYLWTAIKSALCSTLGRNRGRVDLKIMSIKLQVLQTICWSISFVAMWKLHLLSNKTTETSQNHRMTAANLCITGQKCEVFNILNI